MALLPAHGRKYNNKAEVTEAYLCGKDFILADISSPEDGRLCSCIDFLNQPMEVRYGGRNQKCITLTKETK